MDGKFLAQVLSVVVPLAGVFFLLGAIYERVQSRGRGDRG